MKIAMAGFCQRRINLTLREDIYFQLKVNLLIISAGLVIWYSAILKTQVKREF